MASIPTTNVQIENRVYQDFSGVDFSNETVKSYRSPKSINMWKDYNNSLGKGIETRPGMKKVGEFDLKILGLFFYNVDEVLHVIVHAGTKLYEWTNYPTYPAEKKELYSKMNIIESQAFVFNNILFIKDGINYLEYNGEELKEVEGTIPTTTISKKPNGAGETYQSYNLLTGWRKNSFVADGESREYYLDTTELDDDIVSAEVNGNTIFEGAGLTVDRKEGKVVFNVAPTKPLTDGQDNVIIKFKKTINGDSEKITKCNLLSVFDDRIFFAGNQNYPNTLFHTALNDPRYIPSNNYYNEGNDFTKIKALITGNNCIWVLKEPNQENTTIFYHTPTIDYDYGKIYPKEQSNISTGCVSTGVNFGDDIVFLSDKGLEAINGNLNSEKLLAHRSSLVDAKLINENGYSSAKMIEFRGYLLLLIDSKIYLADSRQMFQNIDIEYEWYYWELPFNITYLKEYQNNLYLANESGEVYILDGTDDNGKNIKSCWYTPKDTFGYEAYRKTTNKNGCVLNVMKKDNNEINILTSIDNKEEELIGTYSDEKGYIVCRIKQKKWKNIQLVFRSEKPFGLFLCTLEAFIGGYLKR